MEYSTLGKTDLQVSRICLGTMTWGEQNTQQDGFAQMDYALDQGVNFWDTAELYSIPGREHTYGATEKIIGQWFRKRKKRDQIILASKIAGRNPNLPWIRGEDHIMDQKNIYAAVEGSLSRLQTDYIDLYQLHWPDRPVNNFGFLDYRKPAEEREEWLRFEDTLEALSQMVSQGKIRHIGVSNETPWGLMKYLELAEERGWPRMASIQNPYSLLNRSFEVGLAEISHRESVGLLAYSPLAFGMLTGKYRNGKQPEGARLTLFGEQLRRYSKPLAVVAADKYCRLAEHHHLSPAQMSLAWVNSRFFTTSTIIGATNMEQLKENIDSLNVVLPEDLIREIEEIHKENPNPSP